MSLETETAKRGCNSFSRKFENQFGRREVILSNYSSALEKLFLQALFTVGDSLCQVS